ncbi:hypothetical protein ES707_19884 [subsurface metagenome]
MVSALGACALFDFLHVTAIKETAFEKARELSNGKGIINLGCGPHRTFMAQVIAEDPRVLANIDIALNGMPRFLQLNIERELLPFADKQFGCSFGSHILEHLDDWRFALAEMVRVADHVVVVLPDPIYFSGWLTPAHKQHFSVDDIQEIAEFYPNVEVYY